jgi:hypothetical protein
LVFCLSNFFFLSLPYRPTNSLSILFTFYMTTIFFFSFFLVF